MNAPHTGQSSQLSLESSDRDAQFLAILGEEFELSKKESACAARSVLDFS
jgi:hypothetical protein